jgi:hypothetical protein
MPFEVGPVREGRRARLRRPLFACTPLVCSVYLTHDQQWHVPNL